jgi:flagellar hook-length control protein FliK
VDSLSPITATPNDAAALTDALAPVRTGAPDAAFQAFLGLAVTRNPLNAQPGDGSEAKKVTLKHPTDGVNEPTGASQIDVAAIAAAITATLKISQGQATKQTTAAPDSAPHDASLQGDGQDIAQIAQHAADIDELSLIAREARTQDENTRSSVDDAAALFDPAHLAPNPLIQPLPRTPQAPPPETLLPDDAPSTPVTSDLAPRPPADATSHARVNLARAFEQDGAHDHAAGEVAPGLTPHQSDQFARTSHGADAQKTQRVDNALASSTDSIAIAMHLASAPAALDTEDARPATSERALAAELGADNDPHARLKDPTVSSRDTQLATTETPTTESTTLTSAHIATQLTQEMTSMATRLDVMRNQISTHDDDFNHARENRPMLLTDATAISLRPLEHSNDLPLTVIIPASLSTPQEDAQPTSAHIATNHANSSAQPTPIRQAQDAQDLAKPREIPAPARDLPISSQEQKSGITQGVQTVTTMRDALSSAVKDGAKPVTAQAQAPMHDGADVDEAPHAERSDTRNAPVPEKQGTQTSRNVIPAQDAKAPERYATSNEVIVARQTAPAPDPRTLANQGALPQTYQDLPVRIDARRTVPTKAPGSSDKTQSFQGDASAPSLAAPERASVSIADNNVSEGVRAQEAPSPIARQQDEPADERSLARGETEARTTAPDQKLEQSATGARDPRQRQMTEDLRARALERQVINAARDGADQIRMQLYPPGLGQVFVRITLEGGKLKLQARTATAEAADALRDIADALGEALGQSGLHLASFDVSDEQTGGGRHRPSPSQQPVSEKNDSVFSIDLNA